MKRSRFSEEQIIGILKEHRADLTAHDLRATAASMLAEAGALTLK